MTWPLAASAQQAMPVIGLLTPVLQIERHLRGFQQGLQHAGFVEGDNVSILYRSAENEMDGFLGGKTENSASPENSRY